MPMKLRLLTLVIMSFLYQGCSKKLDTYNIICNGNYSYWMVDVDNRLEKGTTYFYFNKNGSWIWLYKNARDGIGFESTRNQCEHWRDKWSIEGDTLLRLSEGFITKKISVVSDSLIRLTQGGHVWKLYRVSKKSNVYLQLENYRKSQIKLHSMVSDDTPHYIYMGEEMSIVDSIPYVREPLTAVKIAETIIRRYFGDESIDSDVPCKVTFIGGAIWKVEGRFSDHLHEESLRYKGETFRVTMTKDRGKILSVDPMNIN